MKAENRMHNKGAKQRRRGRKAVQVLGQGLLPAEKRGMTAERFDSGCLAGFETAFGGLAD
jgi:hypothetical protein